MTQRTIFDDTVATRIEQLLQRCDALKRGSECSRPVYFDDEGEAHARRIAAREAEGRKGHPGGQVLPE